MSWYSVDVEADGPIPSKYSMVCFGAVPVAKPELSFYGQTGPVSPIWIPEALAISGFTRTEHEAFPHPEEAMCAFVEWVDATTEGHPVFVSDNPAFDWQFMNYYLHYYVGRNPFGFSARRIGDMYAGICKDARSANNWRHMRKTPHTHNPVDDARGNAEALQAMSLSMKMHF